jgi:hypothetical protein
VHYQFILLYNQVVWMAICKILQPQYSSSYQNFLMVYAIDFGVNCVKHCNVAVLYTISCMSPGRDHV